MSRFKIIVFLLAVGIAGSIVATAYWYYTRVLGHDTQVQREIRQIQNQKSALPDPGVKRFDWAVEMLAADNFDGGRAGLVELLNTFPESSRIPEAKRIIGEMHLDMLFSKQTNTAGKDYIVQPGDGLSKIATKNQTTVECIMRANGLQTGVLQPGDHLFVFPLDFKIMVAASKKTLTLMRGKNFFKEYPVVDLKLPGMRLPKEAKVVAKLVEPKGTPFLLADKMFSCELDGSKTTFAIRSLPRAKPVNSLTVPTALPAASKAKAKAIKKAAADAADEDATLGAETVVTGIFLQREDIEELFTIIRAQTPVAVAR